MDKATAPHSAYRPLPVRPFGYRLEATVGGQKVVVTTGEYPEGNPGVLFIQLIGAEDSHTQMLAAVAQAISISLAHGAPLDEFIDTYVGTRSDPYGVVEGHPSITKATSILDFVFRALSLQYLGKDPGADRP